MIAVEIAIAALASAAATAALAEAASRTRLVDDPASAPERKLQPRSVPAVGGAAILVGLAAASAARGSVVPAASCWPALLLAFALGVADDLKRGGLPPLALLGGQIAAAAVLVACGWRLAAPSVLGPTLDTIVNTGVMAVVSVAAVVLAMNCVNTFDNADGAATAIGILGLASSAPLAAAPLAGFLPFNLMLRRGASEEAARPRAIGDEPARGVEGRAPLAYLGNSGSHLLGVLLVLDPIGRVALLVPLLDLVRVAWARIAAGRPPWKGDRRHLAHRLQRAGLSPASVALLLAAIAAPALMGAITGLGAIEAEPSQRAPTVAIGVALTCAFYAVAVLRSPHSE